MATATFILKEPGSKEETLVFFIFRFNNQKLKYSTGQKIDPRFWNSEAHKARESRQFPGYLEFNALLKRIEATAFDTYRKMLNDGVPPNPELIREALNTLLNRSEAANKSSLLVFARKLIETSVKRPNTIKHYRQTLRLLEEYRDQLRKEILFDMVDLAFYEGFIRFLQGKGYGTNTIGGFIKNLKVFLNEALDRGLTRNVDFKNRRFKTLEEPSESIYLSEAEIKTLYELDLSGNPRLDRVRDLFVIGCYTGLRFSDLIQLKDANLTGNGQMARVMTEKTRELVIIPLHGYIKAILRKHGGVPPETISNQKMNDYLKELGELAGIDEPVTIHSTRGGERISETFQKWELITVHTARRSFATNDYLRDVPTISIMKITGHRTEKAFLKYIKISQEDNANKLLTHPFFNAA